MWSMAGPSRAPQRRALVIGVNYAANESWTTLDRGQEDARLFRRHLIEHRGWSADDIGLMLDLPVGEFPYRAGDRPTQNNIRRRIHRLVQGAIPGDHFVFYFAGHTSQLPSASRSEEDGMDEVLIPCDCDGDTTNLQKHIVDNELKRILVDPLPVGSSLTAVFDSCHSGTLLDLDHYKCNAVYVPWVSKGTRATDTPRNSISRQLALERFASLGRRTALALDDGTLLVRRGELLPGVPARSLTSVFWPAERDVSLSPVRRCMSPERMYACEGMCPHVGYADRAHVVALSACADAESAWEGGGRTMTTSLVDILENHPEITHHQLLQRLSHRLHATARGLHRWSRDRKRERRQRRATRADMEAPDPPTPDEAYEMDNFQNPQLSSHYRLDMNGVFLL